MDILALQRAVEAVAMGSAALRYAAVAAVAAGHTELSEGLATRVLLGPLLQLEKLVDEGISPIKKPVARVPRKVVARAKKPAARGLPKPVDLGGLDHRLARLSDNRARTPDSQLESSNCRALLLEIIRRAAFDWVLYRGSSKLPNRLLAESAYQWLFVEEPESAAWRLRESSGKGLTSFIAICGQLDIDPERVRATVRLMTQRDIMGAGRPAERRKGKGDEAMHGDDLSVFDVDVDSLPVFDCMFSPEPLRG